MTSGSTHILAVGPFDRAEATRLVDQIRVSTPSNLVEGLRIDTGDGYESW
jgi:hypothetical protein